MSAYKRKKGNSLTEGVSFLVGAFMRGNKPLVLLGKIKTLEPPCCKIVVVWRPHLLKTTRRFLTNEERNKKHGTF